MEQALSRPYGLKRPRMERRYSDKEKFRSDLNRPKGSEMSERLLKTLRKFGDFQAEYEGSIPFTRSSLFKDLAIGTNFILTNGLLCRF